MTLNLFWFVCQDLSADESGLEQIDEDEWTDRNFGNSTANDMNTSEDSVSDLESDAEDCEVDSISRVYIKELSYYLLSAMDKHWLDIVTCIAADMYW